MTDIAQTDTDGNALIPGHLYCMVEIKIPENGDPEYPSYGALAWYGSNGCFYDANYKDCEGNDISHFPYDELAHQPVSINLDYVFS